MKKSQKKSKKATPPAQRRVELGEVTVDSGQLMLTDPAYVHGLDGVEFYHQLITNGEHVGEETDGATGVLNGAKIINSWGKRYLGLNLSGFGGDGVFPVYGVLAFGHGLNPNRESLIGIYIDFRENRWEGFTGERITEEEFKALAQQQGVNCASCNTTGEAVATAEVAVAATPAA